MNSVVLDASALIAVLRKEDGFEKVTAHLAGGHISSVNVCEILYKSIQKGATIETVTWALTSLPVTTVPFDDEQAQLVAAIHSATIGRGVSFADRACLALGISKKLPIITGDRAWTDLDIESEIGLFL